MASRSPSRSEGEYLSSDSDAKATRPPSRRIDHNVDRHPRPYHSARSRHPRSRSRSRSPYRAPRGEKRRREEDILRSKHDPRRFSVRYEDDKYSRQSSHSDRLSKRSRTHSRSRSRSPYRHTRNEVPSIEDPTSSKLSVSDQNQAKEDTNKLRNNAKSDDQAVKKSGLVDTPVESIPAQPLSEAELIEARRKRREAIKNQYRSQATPLLVQALHIGESNSEAATPGRSVSPTLAQYSTPGTPGTPQTTSGPQSPIDPSFNREDDMFNRTINSPGQAEGHSAADYDPTIDMQEERARHDKKLFKEDEQSIDTAEKQVIEQKQPATTAKAEFDMFADDDDDMFAEEPVGKSKIVEKSAQALDVNMMDNWDDPEGYYITISGELIDSRYQVTTNLGRGMFASVVRATDTKSNQPVAIKIVRNNETMRKAGIKEVDILKDLAANDPDDKKHVVRLLRSFDHKGHLCMVFENMSMNLREVLKKFGRDVGINLKAIRAYAHQLFLGLSLMRKCQYLHADLKPDNILVNEGRNVVKIADLGSASPISENATAPYLVSRFYRAPEIILGMEYDYGIDIWSVGCTLFELYTGKILFTGRNNNNMLRNIMECRGKFPHKLLRKGTLTYDYFDDLLNFRAQEEDKVTGRIVTKLIDVKAKPVRDLKSRLMPKDKKIGEQERRELDLFLDLLDKTLDLRPEKRITPIEALKHPFITRQK